MNNFWKLYSQSQLNIPDSIGFTDGYMYSIEIADRARYKFITHHCPEMYLEIPGMPVAEIKKFIGSVNEIIWIAYKYKVIVPFN